ncbi:hypothetical protein GCM10027290_61540 [Micromonospora sonneratiae]|uniref:Uncharacterized protein n=1 Tax=Micromonospora sonneratiae TaxID=1184706 RepID=A0ABW3YLY7_9ACTN
MRSTKVGSRHTVEHVLHGGDPATLQAAGEVLLRLGAALGEVANLLRGKAQPALPAFVRAGSSAVRLSMVIVGLADAAERLAAPLRGQGRALAQAADALSTTQHDLAEFQRDVSAYEVQMRAIGVACDRVSIDREADKILQGLVTAYQGAVVELERPLVDTTLGRTRLTTSWVVPPPSRQRVSRSILPVGLPTEWVVPAAEIRGGAWRGRVDG